MMPQKKKDAAMKRTVVPDVPQMRSVMMQPRSSAPALHGAPPPPPPKPMGMMRPTPKAMGMSLSPPGMALRGGVVAPPPMPLQQQQRPNAIRSLKVAPTGEKDPWRVVAPIPLPKMYFLGRTHVCVANVEPRIVAQRIATCFQKESIAAEYNSKESMAKAETMNHILLVVRLFADKGKKVVVEIQREQGDKFLFHQVAKTILNAASAGGENAASGSGKPGGVPAPPRFLARAPPKRCPPPPPKAFSEEEQRRMLLEGVEISAAMISEKRMDANDLAMEGLLRATKTPCSNSCKAFIARKILASETLLGILILQIKCCCSDDGDSDEMLEEEEQPYDQKVHLCCRLAMTIFANCLDALEKSRELSVFLKENEKKFFRDGLLHALVEQLQQKKNAPAGTSPHGSVCPHNACQAARCLHPLVRYSTTAKTIASDLRLLDSAVSSLCDLGANTHTMLEKESNLLRLELELGGCNTVMSSN